MVMRILIASLLAAWGLVLGGRSSAAELELLEGDRVVLLGNTLIEREQSYGYWESMLVTRFPNRNVTFRNLGWSGDTVWGESRAGFGTPADGFKALREHVAALQPTVIFVGYGANEAFAGDAGLPRFREGLNALLDALAATQARIVILAPLRHEKLAPPLPDPAEHNRRLWHYVQVLHDTAIHRDLTFVDLDRWIEPVRQQQAPFWTDDGMHLTPYGYWMTAAALENDLQLPRSGWSVDLRGEGPGVERSLGTTVSDLAREGHTLRFALLSSRLPVTAPWRPPGHAGVVRVHGLAVGKYALAVNGRRLVAASADEWAQGVAVDNADETRQCEELRHAIIAKNEWYFHRWRPQNQTYLFGFRKHEQGQNAKEIVAFDPLVAAQEKRIAALRVPVKQQYTLTLETEAPQ